MAALQVAAFCIMVVAVGAFLPGEMLPNNPAVYPGDTLVLNCTLLDHKKNLTSRDLYFRSKNVTTLNYTTILDNSTIQLRLPNVTEKIHRKFFFCRGRVPNGAPLLVGMQIVTVIINPVVPNITRCIINDFRMTCTWSPTGKEQSEQRIKQNVKDNLYWKIRGEADDTWKSCPQQSSGTCIWPRDVNRSAVYIMKIDTEYAYANVSGTYTIDASEIIQVNPVTTHSERHISATSLWLEWPRVEHSEEVLYRLNYSHPSIIASGVSKTVQTTGIQLNGLTPYQPYGFSIEAKTKVGGYWSRPYKSTFFSRSDVPAKNPDVKIGGFSVTEKVGSPCVEVAVYWKTLSIIDQHGPDFTYNVNVKRIAWCDMPCDSREKAESHVQLTIPKNCTIDVTVTSVNVNGTSIAAKTPIRIEPTKYGIAGPSNITVIALNDTEVIVRWNSETNKSAATGYTVFWCRGMHHVCDDEIEWVSVPADTNHAVLHLSEEFKKYEFAASREEGRVSSGMVISNCTYQDGEYSPPPGDFAVSETTEVSHGEVALQWKAPECHIHRGYIYGYELTYCQTKDDKCPTKDTDDLMKVIVSSTEKGFILTGLEEHARYCVTIKSLTTKGPSILPSDPQCAVVTGPWWTTGRIIGFTIGSVLVLALVIFGVIRFWSHCHRLYSKFQQGIRVELPHTSYSTQFSVSSQRGLIDQYHSFSYNVEDFSTPGVCIIAE